MVSASPSAIRKLRAAIYNTADMLRQLIAKGVKAKT